MLKFLITYNKIVYNKYKNEQGEEMKNYYQILEVDPRASKEVIEKAYKALVKKYHPDLYGGAQKYQAEKKLKDLNEAFDILSDDFLREQYNSELRKEQMKQDRLKQEQMRQETQEDAKQNVGDTQKQTTTQKETFRSKVLKRKSNVGTLDGIIDLLKAIFTTKPKDMRISSQSKEGIKTSFLAIGLTIITILILGVILWFIPFTNGWMRQVLFENPLFNMIGSLFS